MGWRVWSYCCGEGGRGEGGMEGRREGEGGREGEREEGEGRGKEKREGGRQRQNRQRKREGGREFGRITVNRVTNAGTGLGGSYCPFTACS